MSTAGARVAWNDRFFASFAVAPAWVGLGLCLALLAAFLLAVWWSGELRAFAEADRNWWQDRNGRVALVLVLIAAYLPTARRYERLEFGSDLEDLRRGGLCRDAAAAGSWTRPLLSGLLALFVVPLVALSVDRDPGLYLRADYWVGSNLFIWGVGGLAAWHAGVWFDAVRTHARHLAQVARGIPELPLLRLEAVAPFTRYGMRCALLWALIPALWAFNLVERGFLAAVGSTAAVAAIGMAVALLPPLRGVRDRIRAAKRTELARIDAALAGNPEALRDSALRRWTGPLGVADLLAYRDRIESVREWPLDPPTFARFGLYLLIPVGSWLGGALVERIVDALLE